MISTEAVAHQDDVGGGLEVVVLARHFCDKQCMYRVTHLLANLGWVDLD